MQVSQPSACLPPNVEDTNHNVPNRVISTTSSKGPYGDRTREKSTVGVSKLKRKHRLHSARRFRQPASRLSGTYVEVSRTLAISAHGMHFPSEERRRHRVIDPKEREHGDCSGACHQVPDSKQSHRVALVQLRVARSLLTRCKSEGRTSRSASKLWEQ